MDGPALSDSTAPTNLVSIETTTPAATLIKNEVGYIVPRASRGPVGAKSTSRIDPI